MSTLEKPPWIWTTIIIFGLTALAAVTIVPAYGYFYGYDFFEWATAAVFCGLTGFSITAGYHRLWSHKAYKAHPIIGAFFAFWGAAALQNSILIWASGHRRHHRYTDDNERDPYSINRGFWFAHIGWMLRDYRSGRVDFKNVKDLKKDPLVMFQHKYYIPLVLFSNLFLPVFIGYLHGDILGTFLLAGILRLVLNHHFTFFINSLAHMWGKQPYNDTNTAKDNMIVAFLTYGEGYHNYHHFFQYDYRNGAGWWQFDPTKWLIGFLSWFKLTTDLKRVSGLKIQEALVRMQFRKADHQLKQKIVMNIEVWRETREKEYQKFLETMNEWKALRLEWYEKKRLMLAEKKQELQQKWESAAIHTRLKEVEYALKMQKKRLKLFNVSFAKSVTA